jgi:hypothetical protein
LREHTIFFFFVGLSRPESIELYSSNNLNIAIIRYESVRIMVRIDIEVIGSKPPCSNCEKLFENAENAANEFASSETSIEVSHRDVSSREVIQEYGALVSPALAINGTVKIMGRVAETKEIQKLLEKFLAKEE